MKDTGYKVLKQSYEKVFESWGRYMRRAQIAEMKAEKLKALLLLTDPAVSDVEVSDTQIKQWNEFIKAFPEESK